MSKAEPLLVINDLHTVDDAGGVHHEAILTGEQIHNMLHGGLLRFEGNIRPDWRVGKMKARTKNKVSRWAKELLDGDGVMGNLSIRIDPDGDDTDYEVRDGDFVLFGGYFDTAVDSESRFHSIDMAFEQIHTMDPDAVPLGQRRFAVRIWVLTTADAHRVGSKFNTEGEKVNESAAKSAYAAEYSLDDLANRLIRKSPHLTYDNVESLTNSVSASSASFFSFNTLSRAMQDYWTAEPYDDAGRDEMVDFLASYWDALVKVRPEFGRMSLEKRRELRGSSVAGTALSIYGVIAIAGRLWDKGIRDFSGLQSLSVPAKTGNGHHEVDFFSYQNKIWQDMGVLGSSVTSAGQARLTVRSSFQTRKAVATAMLQRTNLA